MLIYLDQMLPCQGVILKFFLGDGTTKTCGHDCDQAHLVSWFTCNKRVIADASSNPPVSCLKLL